MEKHLKFLGWLFETSIELHIYIYRHDEFEYQQAMSELQITVIII